MAHSRPILALAPPSSHVYGGIPCPSKWSEARHYGRRGRCHAISLHILWRRFIVNRGLLLTCYDMTTVTTWKFSRFDEQSCWQIGENIERNLILKVQLSEGQAQIRCGMWIKAETKHNAHLRLQMGDYKFCNPLPDQWDSLHKRLLDWRIGTRTSKEATLSLVYPNNGLNSKGLNL
jgi:hypothetical protein